MAFVIGRIREVKTDHSERKVCEMQSEQITKTHDGWNPENDIDLAGILLTISAIAKRLASLLLENQKK